MPLDNLVDDCLFLALYRRINHIRVVHARNGAVGGDFDDVQRVNGPELVLLCLCGTRHAGKLVVKPEIVLEGYGSMGLIFLFDLNFFLCLYCLVKSVGVSSAVKHTTGKFVDNQNFAVVGNNIILVAGEQLVRFKRLLYVVVQIRIFYIAEVVYAEKSFRLFRAVFGYGYGFFLSVDYIIPVLHFMQNGVKFFARGSLLAAYVLFPAGRNFLFRVLFIVVEAARKRADEFIHVLVQLRAFASPAGDYKRSPRLVYKNGVDLVDYTEVKLALDHGRNRGFKVVPQIVEAQLVIGCVNYVAVVRFFLFVVVHAGHDHADGKPHEFMNLTHPLRVALCEVVVDGDDMHALTRKRV